ncbi:SRPBCC family protein [Pseudonocardia sp. NPDC049635]|uniref:SRPBCC family protein n=1 Tax=Pseudonocardia sp. NPDC049635 TaxID=3155506 RepID=UPI0033F82C82
MPRSFSSAVIDAHPDAVWAYIRDFNRTPDYLDIVSTSEITDGKPSDQIGCERVMVLSDGGVVKETLIGIDDAARTLVYHLTEGPFAFSGYYSTMRVHLISESGQSFVDWSSTYDCQAEDAKSCDDLLASGIYSPGLATIKAKFTAR